MFCLRLFRGVLRRKTKIYKRSYTWSGRPAVSLCTIEEITSKVIRAI